MTLEQYLKKNAKRITRLEREIDKLFEGTSVYTSIEVERGTFRGIYAEPRFQIQVYIENLPRVYNLEDFANMTAMIAQIKHDMKEVRAK